MQLTMNGLPIEVPDTEVQRLVLERLKGGSPILMPQGLITPPLGVYWPERGGIFVGTVLGIEGERNYHLIIGPECEDRMSQPDGMKYAAGIEVGVHKDFTLPNRREQRFLQCNGHGLFKPEFYWSCEQHAADADFAFGQTFDDGYQDLYHKSLKSHVRAVRRDHLPIQ